MPGFEYHDVLTCPRCGQSHKGLLVRELTHPTVPRVTHWTICPTLHEPCWGGWQDHEEWDLGDVPRVRRRALTLLVLALNAALDAGGRLDPDETIRHVEADDLFGWLAGVLEGLADLSLYTQTHDDAAAIITACFKDLLDCCGMPERKWGVKNNGLCMLLGWTNELIQQGRYLPGDEPH
jgi:hypothetical protein